MSGQNIIIADRQTSSYFPIGDSGGGGDFFAPGLAGEHQRNVTSALSDTQAWPDLAIGMCEYSTGPPALEHGLKNPAACRVGGGHVWYAEDWLWRIRGLMDVLVGGPGLRRGSRNPMGSGANLPR